MRSNGASRVLQYVGLSTLAVVTLALVAMALRTPQAPPDGATDRQRSPSPTSQEPQEPLEPLRLTILGDSWMEGTGAAPGAGMADQIAKSLGAVLTNLSSGGTGYVNDAPPELGRVRFSGRVPAVLASNPDVIIVSGGLNDRAAIDVAGTATVDDLRAAAGDVFSQLTASGARVVVLGPFWPTGEPVPGALEIRDVLAQEADAVGADFVDPIAKEWITGDPVRDTGNAARFIGPDNAHPTPAGHTHVARHVVEALGALGITAR